MHLSLGRRILPLVGLLTAGLVAGGISAPARADDAATPSPAAEAAPATSSDAAAAALAKVQRLLRPATQAWTGRSTDARRNAEAGAAGRVHGRDLTMALRDLRMHQDELSTADRAVARKATERPPTDQQADFGGVRVHWLSTDPNSTPAWVAQVGATAQQVLTTYAAAGYRAPKNDGDGIFDVYTGPLGVGLYGFCDTDPSTVPPSHGPYDVPAFCAFNSDYSWAPRTPVENLLVTAAHELFHAVQFAYDYYEDQWFMEATATWAEDELYTDINDNRQYLAQSPLKQPRESLDQFISGGSLRQYGEWIFFRYLTERFPAEEGGLPVIIRHLWERVDGSAGGPDNYSIQGVKNELVAQKTTLRAVFARFADANRRPASSYSEGAAYPVAKPARTFKLSTKRRAAHDRIRINHLASATVTFVPHGKLTRKSWRLRLGIDAPNTGRGSAAVMSVYRKNGSVATSMVRLDKRGRGHVAAKFSRKQVRKVELTLVNASTRYQCWTPINRFSCRGIPLDDAKRMPFSFKARVTR